MNDIQRELAKMNLAGAEVSLLDQRAETTLARVSCGNTPCILKCYRTEGAKREIRNYALLSSLGIPTPLLLQQTDSAILMEDLSVHPVYRLGRKEDLSSPQTAEKIAIWYRRLHEMGRRLSVLETQYLYEEAAAFTRENMRAIAIRTNTWRLPIWNAMENHYDKILSLCRRLPRTINYNDFFYTNLAVAIDFSVAFMFDYHLLGKGYAYADIRNVCSSLAPSAQKAFLDAYGSFDPLEQAVDAIISPVIALHLACQRPQFPSWAKDSLNFLENGMANALEFLIAES